MISSIQFIPETEQSGIGHDQAIGDRGVEIGIDDSILEQLDSLRTRSREIRGPADAIVVSNGILGQGLRHQLSGKTTVLWTPKSLFDWSSMPTRIDRQVWNDFVSQPCDDEARRLLEMMERLMASGGRIILESNETLLRLVGTGIAQGILKEQHLGRIELMPAFVNPISGPIFNAWVSMGMPSMALPSENQLKSDAWLRWALECWDNVIPIVLGGRVLSEINTPIDTLDRVSLALLLWSADERSTVPVRLAAYGGAGVCHGLARINEATLLDLLGSGTIVASTPQRAKDFYAEWLQGVVNENDSLDLHWGFWEEARWQLVRAGFVDPRDPSKLGYGFRSVDSLSCQGRSRNWTFFEMAQCAEIPEQYMPLARRFLFRVAQSNTEPNESGAWWKLRLRRPTLIGGEYDIDVWLGPGNAPKTGMSAHLSRGQPMDCFGRSFWECVTQWRSLEYFPVSDFEFQPLKALLGAGFWRISGGKVHVTPKGRTLREYVGSRWPGLLTAKYANDVRTYLETGKKEGLIQQQKRMLVLLQDLAYRLS